MQWTQSWSVALGFDLSPDTVDNQYQYIGTAHSHLWEEVKQNKHTTGKKYNQVKVKSTFNIKFENA